MSSVASKSKIRRRRTHKTAWNTTLHGKSSLDSSRFRTLPDKDELNAEDNDHPPVEPAISIFDLIEKEKSKALFQKIHARLIQTTILISYVPKATAHMVYGP